MTRKDRNKCRRSGVRGLSRLHWVLLVAAAPVALGASASGPGVGMMMVPPMLPVDEAEIYVPSCEGDMQRGLRMFSESNFIATLDQMRLAACNGNAGSDDAERAYLGALSAFAQNDPDAIVLLEDFLREFPESVLAYAVRLARADVWFYEGDFRKALTCYNEVSTDVLTGSRRWLYTYRKGLSMVRCGLCRDARPLFESLLGVSQYKRAANFYLGYIEYFYDNYDAAEKYFLKVNDFINDDEEKDLNVQSGRRRSSMPREKAYVPTGLEAGYYLTQIEYKRGQYDEVIRHGTTLLKKQYVAELAPEMNRIIGLSYFKKGDYSSARGFLHNYVATPDLSPMSDAIYALGVIDYANGDYESAYNRFQTLTEQRDEIAQSAELYLGQCDLKRGEPQSAAMHFERAARMGFDRKVTETALYDYIVSVANGQSAPFGATTALMEEFVATYPDSPYTPSIRESLAAAYFNNRDYAKALSCLDRIKNPSAKVLTARQKVLFELGVECVSNSQFAKGASYLRQAVALHKYDRQVAGEASLWLGDALYGSGLYNDAAAAYRQAVALLSPGENRSMAQYNLGYALLKTSDYAEASKIFSEVISSKSALPLPLQNDARLRQGDCLYYTGRWRDAEKVYGVAVERGGADSDYAWWRRAVMKGLSGDINGKLADLSTMESRFPQSRWLPDAMLERGMTLASRGDASKAEAVFAKLNERYPQTSQSRKGFLNRGLALVKTGNKAGAMEVYREIIRRWPGSDEAGTANEDLRQLSADAGVLDEYVAFMTSVPGAPEIDSQSLEQLSYESALDALESNATDYVKLEKFVANYPSSRHLTPALLALAQARYDNGDYEDTLSAAQMLLDRRTSASETTEASLLKALALVKLNQDVQAVPILESLSRNTNTLAGAQASVVLGEVLLKKGDSASAEKLLSEFTTQGTPHQYWLARGFVALADVYHSQGRKALALEYIKSLDENYPGSEKDVREMIAKRLKSWK